MEMPVNADTTSVSGSTSGNSCSLSDSTQIQLDTVHLSGHLGSGTAPTGQLDVSVRGSGTHWLSTVAYRG